MNWRYEWVAALDEDVYDVLVTKLQEDEET